MGLPTLELVQDLELLDEFREPLEKLLDDVNYRLKVGMFAAISHREYGRFGRKPTFQYKIYSALEKEEPLRPVDLSNTTGIRYKTVSSSLDRLKKKGMAKIISI